MKTIKAFAYGIVTAYAVLAGLFGYLKLACQLFWEEYGETVSVGALRFAVGTVDLAGEVLALGREARVQADRLVSVLADRAFYLAAGY